MTPIILFLKCNFYRIIFLYTIKQNNNDDSAALSSSLVIIKRSVSLMHCILGPHVCFFYASPFYVNAYALLCTGHPVIFYLFKSLSQIAQIFIIQLWKAYYQNPTVLKSIFSEINIPLQFTTFSSIYSWCVHVHQQNKPRSGTQ